MREFHAGAEWDLHEVRYVREHDGVFVMPNVASNAIIRIEYDELSQELVVIFTSGEPYTYYRVPRDIYDRFVNAASKGQFFNTYIKDHYRFTH
jgi:hypothetical protein